MKIEKLQLSKQKLEINLQFYFFLKHIVKLNPSNGDTVKIITSYNLFSHSIELFVEDLRLIFKGAKERAFNKKLELIEDLISRILSVKDIELFLFSIKLYQVKNLLMQEIKITDISNVDKLSSVNPLSLEYDKISVFKPYNARVKGALLSLLFFNKLEKKSLNFISENALEFIKSLSDLAVKFKKEGIEPNQIFMLIFSESVNQSIISDSGLNYENRILSVLSKNGIKDIKKTHDKDDKSTEFYCFFEIEGRTFGIGAKRTLRERYKQFIKTSIASKIDVIIEVTLGLDLNEEKARIITNHGTHIFVADEVYRSREYLQALQNVHSANDLTYEFLKNLH